MQFRRKIPLLLIPAGILLWLHQSEIGGDKAAIASSGTDVASQLLFVAAPLNVDDKDTVDESGDRSLDAFMQQKLSASSLILKGLMIDDLKLVEQNADKLLDMSREEQWRASNDMMYLQHSTQFRNAVDDLRKKAAKQSTDGASLAWVNVTMSCIQCHQWVRNIVLADLPATETSQRN